jgi:hypothetical protein
MELRLNIDDQLFADIARSLGKSPGQVKPTDITREALAVYKWVAEQKSGGFDVVSATTEGPRERVVTPLLQGIRSPN